MSDFAVRVEAITIEPHPNADRLALARVGLYRSVVGKDQFQSGDLVAYIPEQAVVPDDLLEEMGLVGKLAGKAKNRVKAIKLRGILSQGICYRAREGWVRGQDVAEELGIEKYVPPIPTHMAGRVWAAGHQRTLRYDIENIKRYPHIFEDGEEVVFTEKIHGTWTLVGLMPSHMADPDQGDVVVSSKGYSAQGLAFQLVEENEGNLYLRTARKFGIVDALRALGSEGLPVFVLGETFGAGVQDLGYGHNAGTGNLGFRVFDIYSGLPGQGVWASDEQLDAFVAASGIPRVPVLYRGPFGWEAVEHFTNGTETVSGNESHVREGIVIRPAVERIHPEIGRVQLKSVSEQYLLRKGKGTEYQ